MKDENSSTWNKVKGTVKEGVGRVAGDRELEREGRIDEKTGNIQDRMDKGHSREGAIRKELDDKRS